MRVILCIASLIAVSLARPEPPSGRYGPPSAPPQKYGAPQYLPPPPSGPSGPSGPGPAYGPPPPSGPPSGPSAPEQQYGAPPANQYLPQAPQYGPPAPVYGPPPPQKIVTKNVYIHIPPEEPVESLPQQVIETQVPKKHYKIIFIKAPVPPTPTVPVIPEQQQDEHKTLVYVLVKKPDPQPLIDVPLPAPTEPTKPEVYFIKYKENEKQVEPVYGPPGPYKKRATN